MLDFKNVSIQLTENLEAQKPRALGSNDELRTNEWIFLSTR